LLGNDRETVYETTSTARQQILKKQIYAAVTEKRLSKQTYSHANESTRINGETVRNSVFYAVTAEML
jgi:hypothetical protein